MSHIVPIPFAPRSQRGDHIYLHSALGDAPETLRIQRDLGCHASAVIGALFVLWSWADEFADDTGFMAGLALEDFDAYMDLPGFAAAVEGVGWLEVSPDGVLVVNPGYFMSAGQYEEALCAEEVA